MRPRAQVYRGLEGINAGIDLVSWYWRLLANVASILILGGFLMLPITFDTDPLLHISNAGVGIFAVVILVAGLTTTLLISFRVRSLSFQADSVFQPALISCTLGFLTVFYGFIISARYVWNTPAVLTVIASAMGSVSYAGALLWVKRKIKSRRPTSEVRDELPLETETPPTIETEAMRWQPPEYYENYIRNMYPSAAREPTGQPQDFDPHQITEEEMQRQQMLMLLLKQDEMSNTNSSSNTFRIDWQAQENDEPASAHRLRSYDPGSAHPSSAYSTLPPTAVLSRQLTQELQPWDGVWRGVTRQPISELSPEDLREVRRREIEQSR